MIVYLVRNMSKSLPTEIAYKETEKIFLDREKAIAQYEEWTGPDIFEFGVTDTPGLRSVSYGGDKSADFMPIEVIE